MNAELAGAIQRISLNYPFVGGDAEAAEQRNSVKSQQTRPSKNDNAEDGAENRELESSIHGLACVRAATLHKLTDKVISSSVQHWETEVARAA